MSQQDVRLKKPALVDVYREALVTNTPLTKLDEKLEKLWTRNQVAESVAEDRQHKKEQQLRSQLPRLVRFGALLLPIGFIALGLFLLGNAVIPISSYYLQTAPTLSKSDLTTPIPREEVLDITPTVVAQTVAADDDADSYYSGPTVIDTKLDYTNLANWFGEASVPELSGQTESAEAYVVDIPKLDIEGAVVNIGGTDLNQGLIQYPGTASPGQAGAPVIFGHSVLRQFYNPSPKNPRRYVSIFSTIMTLEPGDKIFVTHNGAKYTYLMRDKTEVKPEDVYILTQNYDAKQLKLVTCTPEGTYLRRGVVTAQLVSS